MQSRVLLRESKKLLGLFHSLLGNKARCLKKQSTGGASKTSDREGTASDEGTVPPLVPKTGGPPDQTASESSVSRLCSRSGPEVTSEQPPALSQELLTEAFAKQWSTETDMNSPLLPTAPQPSPVGFPGNEECQIVFPHLLKIGDPSRLDHTQMLLISDSEAVYNLNRVQEGLST
ncbi:hypothetical protein OJAV_G00003420 [Oryzias javanicus]|uniref:Uncharacterized protein n=1 Tax=Oryzias javanicus TaxID=123683 RepID=A0A3S2MH94_ORYJA|nr:hypothetical protein OJAV_G00003420 [Oryzias javanicus]